MLKVHSVKSNAKRAARKLCETFAGIEVAEPFPATSPLSGWRSAVRVAEGVLPSSIAPEVLEAAVVVDLGPLWIVRGTEIVRSPAGIEADEIERVDPESLVATAAFMSAVAANGGTNEGMGATTDPATDCDPVLVGDTYMHAHDCPAAIEQGLPRFKAPADKPSKAGGRRDQVFALLRRPEGATLAQVMEETGWLAHTTRAFISVNARKLGLSIEKEKTDAGQVYRAVEPKAAA